MHEGAISNREKLAAMAAFPSSVDNSSLLKILLTPIYYTTSQYGDDNLPLKFIEVENLKKQIEETKSISLYALIMQY